MKYCCYSIHCVISSLKIPFRVIKLFNSAVSRGTVVTISRDTYVRPELILSLTSVHDDRKLVPYNIHIYIL